MHKYNLRLTFVRILDQINSQTKLFDKQNRHIKVTGDNKSFNIYQSIDTIRCNTIIKHDYKKNLTPEYPTDQKF